MSANTAFIGEYDNSSLLLRSGLKISFREEGESDDAVLLLHGLNGHSGTWRKTIPFFSRTRKMIAPSLPPWRKSIQDLDIDGYVRYVFELLDGLDVQRVSVLGNSMGGWIAMRMAILRPEVTNALILEDSAGVSDPHEKDVLKLLDSTDVPVLIAWGSEDRIIPLDAGRYLHSQLHNSQLQVFERAGHVPHWERPEEFNARVSEFLDSRRKQSR
ncbi:MAG: alpha/beta hydrolase [Nitrososphaerota archaeon]|nr:alpha/beta hydrolase [Nitrososphaerota archaeon]